LTCPPSDERDFWSAVLVVVVAAAAAEIVVVAVAIVVVVVVVLVAVGTVKEKSNRIQEICIVTQLQFSAKSRLQNL
jgi:hypothetical protein